MESSFALSLVFVGYAATTGPNTALAPRHPRRNCESECHALRERDKAERHTDVQEGDGEVNELGMIDRKVWHSTM